MTTPGARALRPEDELSHYRIVSPLGVGGMGEVYLAQDRKLERNVAIKVLPGDLVRSEERVRRFVQEARSASSLSHPNIVTIYEIGQDAVRSPGEPPSEPVHYISMELVSGKTLATLIHEDRTDLRTLLGYLAQAADGVAKAHAAGIVHRDLKPGNIMVSADGFAKVLDFGLAKLTERREGDPDVSTAPTMVAEPTAAGVVVGTAGYMSPEQVRAKPVDHRADIFAFGCILYEAAARRRPFSAESGVETMHKILHDQPPPIEELNPRVPAELRRLIRRCLQKNPEQRLQSMKDLALELRELVDEYDSLSATASSGSMASAAATAAALPARRGMSPLAIGVIVIVVVAGAAAVWWGLRQGGGAGDRGFQDMQLSTQTTRGDVIDAVLSQDGRYLAYTAGTAGQAGLYVRQVATGSDVEVLAPNTNGLENPAFSPDGNYLFYLMRKPDAPNYRTLFQVPSLGGTSREVTFDVDTRVTFSPDGKQLAFWRGVPQANEDRLVLYDLEARRERVMASIPSDRTFSAGPAWSPDGSRIAVALFRVRGEVATELATYDVSSGRRRDLATLPVSQVSGLAWLRDGKGLVITRLEAQSGISRHVALVSYPAGGVRRVTNDFSNYSAVSVSGGDEAIGAVRQSNLANLWVADAEGGGSRRITTITNPDASPGEIQPLDARTIAFGAPRDRFLQIWTVPASGGEARPVTNDDHQKFNLVTAPGRLVFDRIDETGIHVWTSNPDGSGLRQLTRGSGEQSAGEQAISPDGRRLLYTMGFSSGIKTGILDLESGRTDSLPSAFRGGTGFSRDGERILTWRAFSDAAGISRRISYALRADDFSPIDSLRLPDQAVGITWMPDGRGLVFMDSASPVRNLMRMDFGAGAPVPVTRFTDGRVNGFDVSDDGARVAVRRNVGTGSEVWVVGSDGSRPRRIASFDPEQVFEVQWLGNEASVAILAGVLSNDAVLIRKFR